MTAQQIQAQPEIMRKLLETLVALNRISKEVKRDRRKG